MSRSEWLKTAKSKTLVIDGVKYEAKPRVFSTGTVGWYFNGKGDDETIQFSVFVVGSKHWED